MIFREYVNKKSREESGTSQLGTNTLQGLLIITDVINIMKLTHSMCFGGWDFWDLTVEILCLRVEAENFTQAHLKSYW